MSKYVCHVLKTWIPCGLLLLLMVGCSSIRAERESTSSPDSEPPSYAPRAFLEPVSRAGLPPGVKPRPVSKKGLELTAQSEGWRSRRYNDPAGYCTIGYGHLLKRAPCDGSGPEVPFLSGITKQQGLEMLAQDMERIAVIPVMLMVNESVTLTDGQFAALCDFAYNVGPGRLRKSTLLKYVNAGAFDQVPAQFRRYTLAGGRVLPGAVKRREAEIALFFEGLAVPRSVPSPDEDLSPLDILVDDEP